MSTANENRNSTKISHHSKNLSRDENELVFQLIGRKCVSLCTTVAQVYETEPPSVGWNKKGTGVLCFIKDNGKRSYYCRLVCLINHRVIWEQEMYDTIEMGQSQSYLITFEGEDGIVALNFAFEDEAKNFLNVATQTVSNRNRRREERKKRPPPIKSTAPLSNQAVTLRRAADDPLPNQPVKLDNKMPILSNHQSVNLQKSKKGAGKKLTKADIGTPSNFKHVTHVGWDAKKGFDLSGEDESLRPFLQKAGISENQLKDRQTRDFIYSFIESHNVEEVMRKEHQTKAAAPPVPTRPAQNNVRQPEVKNVHNGEKRIAPARPPPLPQKDYSQPKKKSQPTRERETKQPPPPPLPTSTPPVRKQPSSVPNAPPPPPMMPPPPIAVQPSLPSQPRVERPAAAPDPRDALLESIRKGAKLKHVEPQAPAVTVVDSRSDLLSEIRSGVELRSVADRPQENRSSTEQGTDALADALRRALEVRGRAIRPDSSSESDDADDDNEWSD